ncbi:MAG: ATP-dependent helicase [Blautia sp.]|nr:ATP-dependent helicase [Blautia sp.]
MEFNQSQREAILHGDGPMLVLAGPGSGKTSVITERVAHLIQERHVRAENILVITFARAAAGEMRERFSRRMGELPVTFGTFHSVFFRVLKSAYRLTPDNIIPEERRYQLMRELIARFSLEYQDENEFIGDLLAEISMIKNSRMEVAHFYSSHCGEAIFRKIYELYQKRLSENRLLDFDDILTCTFELFDQRKDILAAWQRRYPYILIDEFQDINQIQYDIIRMMAEPRSNLFAVGDDDQSIYRFRGSRPELMLGFSRDYPGAGQVTLETNYRSKPELVAAAGRLIAVNRHRFPKKISSANAGKGEIIFQCFEDQRQENAFVVSEIKKALAAGTSPRELAVLCRTNLQPRLLMEQLLEQNIPFYTRERTPNLYEHWIAKDILAYLRIAGGSRARADFLSVMNRPKRYIGRDSLPESEVAFDEWIKMYEDKPWIAERIETLWRDVERLKSMSPYAAVNYIRRGIGYDDYLEEYAAYRGIEKEELLGTAEELLHAAKEHKTVEAWLLHIREYRDKLQELARQTKESPEAVSIATLHGAKGLEYERVFLIDVNEGVMPYKKAVLDAELEEERRLFYVGVTRAKSALCLCAVKQLHNKKAEVSRFVREMGRS